MAEPARAEDAPAEQAEGVKTTGEEGAGEGGAAAPEVEYQESDAAAKTVEDILNKDAEDESLRKYKESLLGAAASGDVAGDPDDPRRVVVREFRILFEEEGAEDVVFNLDTPEGLENMASNPFTIREGANFKFRISFSVFHDIVAALRFETHVRRGPVSKNEGVMLGSYAPAAEPHVFEFPRHGWNEAPSGMLGRGTYHARDTYTDGDGETHLTYEYTFNIRKTW